MVAVTIIVEVKLGRLQGYLNQVRKLLEPSIIQVCILQLKFDHYGTIATMNSINLQVRFEAEGLLLGFHPKLKEV